MSQPLSADAAASMSALALKFELETGNRIRWRNAPEGMAAILNMSLHSGREELVALANQVVAKLCDVWLSELASRGLNVAGASSYRGATPLVADNTQPKKAKQTTYRGVTSQTTSEAPVAAKSQRMYRGQVIED